MLKKLLLSIFILQLFALANITALTDCEICRMNCAYNHEGEPDLAEKCISQFCSKCSNK